MWIKKGVKLLDDQPGTGDEVMRGKFYQMSLRMWLNKGEPIEWSHPFGMFDRMVISPDRLSLTADYRYDREYLFSGMFYGIEDMRIGGKRILEIAPHLAFGEIGVEGMIPPNALLRMEIKILEQRYAQK